MTNIVLKTVSVMLISLILSSATSCKGSGEKIDTKTEESNPSIEKKSSEEGEGYFGKVEDKDSNQDIECIEFNYEQFILNPRPYVDGIIKFELDVESNGESFVMGHFKKINNQNLLSFMETFSCNSTDEFLALVIYFGLNKSNRLDPVIEYYFAPTILKSTNLQSSPVIFEAIDFSLTVRDFTKPLYKFDRTGNVIEIPMKERPNIFNQWEDYKSSITINGKRITLSKDPYKTPGPTQVIMYPLNILESFIKTHLEKDIYMTSALTKTENNPDYSHVIHFSTLSPKNELIKSNPNKLIAEDFPSLSANFSQLCPTKCGKIEARRETNGKYTIQ